MAEIAHLSMQSFQKQVLIGNKVGNQPVKKRKLPSCNERISFWTTSKTSLKNEFVDANIKMTFQTVVLQ